VYERLPDIATPNKRLIIVRFIELRWPEIIKCPIWVKRSTVNYYYYKPQFSMIDHYKHMLKYD